MKTKKRLLSFLSCMLILVTSVTGVFAADEWVPTAETDGVAKHYEYNVNASDITPDLTGSNPVYNFAVPVFNDIGDTITINFKDVAPADKVYNDYLARTEFHCSYTTEDLANLKSWIDPSNPDANLISQNFANGLYKNSVTLNMELYNEEDASNITYMLKIDDKTYIVNNSTLVESTTPAAYPAYSAIDISIESYNDVFGTTLPEVLADDPATTISISQIQLDKIDLQVYYKGNLVSTHNYNDLYTKPIERNMTCSYKITYKLNEDGTVTATAPTSILMSPEAYIQYETDYISWGNKTTDETSWIYNFTDAAIAKNIRVTSLTTNGHHLQTTLDTSNINKLLEIANNETASSVEDMKTVAVTPTISVLDMPKDGTKTEGFDITFKSNVPVVLSTQEAPDVSVCSITNKQSDGSYTGVYHIGEVGNTTIKFNVNPTVASELSDDGLTKTVYNSTSYTLKIKAFASDYEAPVDITDDDDAVVDEDNIITEIPEDTDPVDPNKPGIPDDVPQTGDTTPIIPLMIIMLTSLTVVIFCLVHRKKAKTLLSLILVGVMIGGTLTGIQMNPLAAYAAGNENTSDGTTIISSKWTGYSGEWTITSSAPINFVFTLMDDSLLQEYMTSGWQNNKKLSQNIHYGYATMTSTMAPEVSVYDNVVYHYPHKKGNIAEQMHWSDCDIYTYDSNYVFVDAFFDYKNVQTICNIFGYDTSQVTPDTILSGTRYNTASFSSIKTNDSSETLITDLLSVCANITDINKKVTIARQLFNNSPYVSSINADFMKDKHIVCIPYVRTMFHNDTTGASFLVPMGIHHMTGQTTSLVYDPYAAHTYDHYTEVKNICDKVYISSYNGKANTNGLNTNLTHFRKWRGMGLLFLTAPSDDDEIRYVKQSNTAYSSYINYALDNKNTTDKYTPYNSATGSGYTHSYANGTGAITFKHNYTRKDTYKGGTLVKSDYIDGVVEGVKYTDGKTYTKTNTPAYSQTTSGTFTAPSGTKVTNNSVFNSQGYAVWTGSSSYAPYLKYKWVASSSGGIGNKYSLEITTYPGVYYSTTLGQFTSVANYKNYNNNTIPTLANQFSYLSKNADVKGTNRFSGYTGSKFVANLGSGVDKFTDYTDTQTTVVQSQAKGKTQGIAVATYTPVSITSNIKLVEVVQDGTSLKVNKVSNGNSTSYVNTTTGELTTPAGYTYYKVVREGGTGPVKGDTVTSTGLTACNQTKLTVGASAIDKGYTIYCYKLPDNINLTVDVSTYVKEDYVNNLDFAYTTYESGSWRYKGTPKVTGDLIALRTFFTSTSNTILAGITPGNTSQKVNNLAHQRTFVFHVNRSAYQTLNVSPFIASSADRAGKNGLSGISAQPSANKSTTLIDSATTVLGSAPNHYNTYAKVTARKVYQPLSVGQSNVWAGTTDTFSIGGFSYNKAKINYKNTTYVGVYNAPSIATQSVTNKTITNNGKVLTEVSNTGVKLEFVPHYNMKIAYFTDTQTPYEIDTKKYASVAVMSNYKRSFNSAMLSGYTFTTGVISGTTSSDYVDNNGDTLKGSDITLKVTNPDIKLNTFAYVVDIYGDGDTTEKVNGVNPATEWGIAKYNNLVAKVNTKFSNYLTNVQSNLNYSVILDNEGDEYKDFTVSTSKASPSTSVTVDTQAFVLTIQNGTIVNNTAYQSMIASIKADFGLASTTEAETLFNNSGIKNMIINSMHTNAASNNTSASKWYDEQTNTICIRRFAKTDIKLISNLVVQDKIDYDCEAGDAEWSLVVKNGSTTLLDTEIKNAEFEISDKTTQN